MRHSLAVAALCCALAAAPCRADPFTVEDLLKAESLVTTAASPDGRWLVIQSYAGQADAPRFDYDAVYYLATSRIRIVDLQHPGPATFLVPPNRETGFVPGPFSPSGQRMIVHRLRDHRWESGVVDLRTHKLRWFGRGADFTLGGRTIAWRSETQLVAITHAPDQPVPVLRRGSQPMADLTNAWTRTAIEGGPSLTAIGSGRYLSRGGRATPADLVMIDADTGRTNSLARGDFVDLELAPDGRFLAAIEEGDDLQPTSDETVRGATPSRRRNLTIFALETGAKSRPCQDCDLTQLLLSWSTQGHRLLAFARRPGQSFDEGRLVVVDADAGEASPIERFRAKISYTNDGAEIVQAGWRGDQVLAWGTPSDAPGPEQAWWRVGPNEAPAPLPEAVRTAGQLTVGADGSLIAQSGNVSTLLTSQDQEIGAPTRGFMAIAPGSIQLAARTDYLRIVQADRRLGVANDRMLRLSRDGAVDLGPAVPDTRLLTSEGVALTVARNAHGVQTLDVVEGGRRTRIGVLNPQFAGRDVSEIRPIQHLDPKGAVVTSWLLLPPGWKPGDRPPLVVVPYPSRAHLSATAPARVTLPGQAIADVSGQVIANHGYAVLVPSLLLSSTNDPSEGIAGAILAAVDAAGRQGLVDTDRLALWGHSFGGYTVLAAATQSSRFKVVVASAGITDQISAWGEMRGPNARTRPEDGFYFNAGAGYLETGQMRVGATPWQAPERYVAASPLLHADRISAPVLLLYGDQDLFSSMQGEEMFSALYRQGKDAKLLTFRGEGHVVLAPGNVRRLYAEGLKFLDDALGSPEAASGQTIRP